MASTILNFNIEDIDNKNVTIPPDDDDKRDLLIFISTGHKLKGRFNFDLKTFEAYPVSDHTSEFSLNRLNIHQFVINWEIDKNPDPKYNYKNLFYVPF